MTNNFLQDIHTSAYQRRHIRLRHEVVTDGRIYGVTAVLPIRDVTWQNDTAVDKLRYLVSGTKK